MKFDKLNLDVELEKMEYSMYYFHKLDEIAIISLKKEISLKVLIDSFEENKVLNK